MTDNILKLSEMEDRFSADPEASYTLAAPYFYDEALYRQEQEKIFARQWNYACHQNEIPDAGNYKTIEIAGEPIFVIRGKDNVIRGFYNVCQHRAAQLVQGDGTAASVISCPYHSWSYDFEGNLRGAHACERVKGFEKKDFSLKTVQVEIFAGFVMVNLDLKAQSLCAQAEGLLDWLKKECPEIENYQLAEGNHNVVDCNWKVLTDNFIESYHLSLSGPCHKAFTDLVECEALDVRTHTIWSSHFGPAGPMDNSAFAYKNPRSLGGSNDFVSFQLYPAIGFTLFPGVSALNVFVNAPHGPEQTAQYFAYYTPDGTVHEDTKRGAHYFSYELGVEDNDLCAMVQKGLRSRAYHQGRFMIDEQRSGIGEHAVHHFHSWVRDQMAD